MKLIKLILSYIGLFINGHVNGQNLNLSRYDSIYEHNLSKLLLSSSTVNSIVTNDENYLAYFLKQNSLRSSISSLSTYVHECLHIFNNNNKFVKNEYAFYVGKGNTVTVKKPSNIVKTHVINPIFADLHFNAYPLLTIKDDENMINQDGIYGLIDELSAITQECIFLKEIGLIIDTIKYCNTVDFTYNTLVHFKSFSLSYYKLSILANAYLTYIKENNTILYNQIANDDNLKLVYQKLITDLKYAITAIEKDIVPRFERRYLRLRKKRFTYPFQDDLNILLKTYINIGDKLW